MSIKHFYKASIKWMLVFSCIVFSAGVSSSLTAQKILMTESGQKILLASDGSWSVVQFDETIDDKGNIVNETGTSLDAFQAPNAGKYPLTVEQKTKVRNMLKSLLSDEAQLLVNREFFYDNIETLKEKKKIAKESDNKQLEEELKKQIKLTEASAKKSNKAYEESSKLIADANDLLSGKVKKRDKYIDKLIQTTQTHQNVDSGMGGVVENKEEKSSENSLNQKTKDEDVKNEPSRILYPNSFKVPKEIYPREKYDCEIAFDGYDDILGSNKKEVKSEFFFGFSQQKMKSYFKNDDFIKCDAFVSKVGRKYYITLKLRVKSKDAKKTYGILRANETMRFEMIDGKKVYCTSMIQDNGTIEPYTGHTLYTGIFEINKDDLKTLKDTFLDNIGVIWSSGYEEYNIFNVDFLKNQIQCLEK